MRVFVAAAFWEWHICNERKKEKMQQTGLKYAACSWRGINDRLLAADNNTGNTDKSRFDRSYDDDDDDEDVCVFVCVFLYDGRCVRHSKLRECTFNTQKQSFRICLRLHSIDEPKHKEVTRPQLLVLVHQWSLNFHEHKTPFRPHGATRTIHASDLVRAYYYCYFEIRTLAKVN